MTTWVRSAAADEAAERAEALFQQGRERMGQHDFATACPLLEQAYSIDHGAGTLLALALCHEGSGKLATALREYRESAAMAVRANRSDRVMLAESHMLQLEAAVPRIRVRWPQPEPPDLAITLDGAVIDRTAADAGVPVDPGTHTLAASASDTAPWRTQLEVVAGATTPVVVLPPLVARARAPLPQDRMSGSRVLGWTLFGVSVVAAGVGAYFGVSAFNAESRSKQLCTGTVCPQDGVDLNGEARRDALVSDVTFAIGGAALGAGLWLLLRATSDRHGSGAATASPVWARAEGSGIALGASW
jgi:hypothetical protein